MARDGERVCDGVTIYRAWFDTAAVLALATEAWGHLLASISMGGERRFDVDRRIAVSRDESDLYREFAALLPVTGREMPIISPQQVAHFPGSAGLPIHRDLLKRPDQFAEWDWHWTVGVALTHSEAPHTYLFMGMPPEEIPVDLHAGDVVAFRADIPHRPPTNGKSAPRIALYYRFAEQ